MTPRSPSNAEEWARPLRRLCAVCGVTASRELIDAWHTVLGGFPPAIFASAVDAYLLTATDRFMPMPATIRNIAGDIEFAFWKARVANAAPCRLRCSNGWLGARLKANGKKLRDSVACSCVRGERHSGPRFDPATMLTEYSWTERQKRLPPPKGTKAITDGTAAAANVPRSTNKPAGRQIAELAGWQKRGSAGAVPAANDTNGG